jgi:23S rRNA pseudouridine1911/1915/1917 synthase
MSNLKYVVEQNILDIKVFDYLTENKKLSGRFTKSAGLEHRILVNGKKANLKYRLKSGDNIEIIVKKDETQDILPEDLNIEIAYEDDDIIVVNKPAFMLVHPTPNNPNGTLSNGVMYHFKKTNRNCIVRLVSRLDRDTSGLILIAKNSYSHMSFAKAMEENKITKSYLAVVHGILEPQEGTINLPIGKCADNPIKRCFRRDGQKSITHYKTIEIYSNASLVELRLETGRTHQIRVHLSHLGHPIFGDSLYGKEENEFINRQALHAYKLVFPHPRSGETIELESQLPEDIKKLIKKLPTYK